MEIKVKFWRFILFQQHLVSPVDKYKKKKKRFSKNHDVTKQESGGIPGPHATVFLGRVKKAFCGKGPYTDIYCVKDTTEMFNFELKNDYVP